MRASRRVRAKLRWFVEFLRVFFDSRELEQMAWERIERHRDTWKGHPEEVENVFAYVVASGARRDRFEAYLRQKCADSEEIWRPLLELIEPPTAHARAARETGANKFEWADQSSRETELRNAVEAAPENAVYWANLGDLLSEAPERADEAEEAFGRAIALAPQLAGLWDDLGDLLAKQPGREGEAEAAYRKAIEIDPGSAWFWHDLGNLLSATPGRAAESEAAYRKAIEVDPQSAWSWTGLGDLIAQAPDRASEAEAAYRKAGDLDPQVAWSWSGLGDLLAHAPDRASEAEAAYRKAIESEPQVAWFWNQLGNFLATRPERTAEAEAAYRKAIELDPSSADLWDDLGGLLSDLPSRAAEAEAAYRKAVDVDPHDAEFWGDLGVFLAGRVGNHKGAELALRRSVEIAPNRARSLRNLGVLLYCELADAEQAVACLSRAHQLDPQDPVSVPVSAAILAAALRGSEPTQDRSEIPLSEPRKADFWTDLLDLCKNYPPFGKILIGICDLVQERDIANPHVELYRAVALAQLGDFPRASVAFEDALTGDPIDLLSIGQRALETILAAAIRNGRVRDCLNAIDKKDWKDAWRPIYEALRAVEANSADYLKRVAVEIRGPALDILRRIAPQLPNLPELAVR